MHPEQMHKFQQIRGFIAFDCETNSKYVHIRHDFRYQPSNVWKSVGIRVLAQQAEKWHTHTYPTKYAVEKSSAETNDTFNEWESVLHG